MNAVGTLRTIFAQGVYTVSGPFHPFGGAVDIIVVEQEDGTFKSSPWYVKFGKFQGVLKRREKRVALAVNDGEEANFHMYLDHKGEAYFLKDVQGDETAPLALTEATSSGDESSHTYAREKREAESRAELGKEESEDDRGDDLELKLEGREASKQLIQEHRDCDALDREKINATQSEPFTEEDGRQENIVPLDSGIETSGGGAGSEHIEHIERKFRHALCGTDGGPRKDGRSKSARDFLSDAACASHTVSTPYHPGFNFTKHGMTHDGENASRNGMLIHCLLNLAVGRQPIDKSGTAVALVAKAALSSLERVVSGPQTLDADNKFSVPQGQQKLARFHDSVSNPAKPPEDVVGESSSGESDIRQDKDLVEDILSKAFTGGPRSYTGNTCNDVKSMIPVSSVANFSGADADKVANVVSQPFPVGPCPENFDASTTLEVKRVEIRDDAVVVQVRERLEVERHGQFPLEEGDVIENIVIDRSQLENEAFGRRDDAEQHGEHVESGGSQKLAPEEYEGDITVEVNKHLVEELKAGLEENENEDREMVLAAHETPTNPRQEGPGTSIEKEDASSSHTPPTGTQDAPAGIQGNSKKRGGVENEPTLGRTTSGKKVALANQVNVPNVSSPRQKAAVDLEMAWRQVMDRAATSLKGAPYASEKLHHSASDKKVNSTISGSHGKEGGSDEVQAERKSWGWLWGGSSAPQPKQGSDQDGTKDGKRKESSAEGELPGVISEKSSETASEVLTKKTKANKSLTESQTNQVEAVGKYTGSGVESGRTEGRKGASNVSHLNGNEHPSESTPNNQAQQQTKRRFFGIFGSGNSPSLASSAQRDDDQHSVRPLKSEDSLEKAENMLDIYEQTWEKGFHANQGFSKAKDPPVKKVLEAKITETVMDLGGEAEISDSHTEDSNIKQGGTIETDVDLRPAEDLTDLPNIHRCRSPSGSGLVTEAATPQAAERDENPALSNQLFNEAQVSPTVSYAETGRESDPQPEIGVDVNWPAERQPNTPTSDTSPNGLKSISNTDVVILSADGRILAAPIVDQEELEALEENHEQEQRQELAVDVGDNYINAGKSPRGAIRFADVPKSVERPFVGPDENRPLSNGVHPESQCEVITSSENVHQLMDIQGGNCTEIVSAGNGAAVPKGLAIIMEFEDTKGSQAKAWGDSDKGVRQESGLTLDTRTCLAISDDGQATSNGVGSTEMQRRTDAFGDPNIADDGDTLDSSKQEMERFFSSRNLFEPDETKRFRRPNYLDAVGVDNDQDTLDTVTEDEPNKSSEKTDPIEIPGAGRRARNFASLDDPQILRTSESLPNARHHTLDPDMASPGLTMSRSLDSAPLSALLTSDRSEVIPSSVLLTTGSEGNVAVGAERHLEHSQAESRPAEDSFESHKQDRATGFELSLCRHLLKEKMGAEAAADAFASEKITLEEFRNSGSVIAANDKLVVRVGDQYYPWVVASPIVLGILAFGQVLVSPDEGAIAVEKPTVTFDGQSPVNPLTTVTSAGWSSKLWLFGGGRRPKTPEKENVTDLVSKDELQLEAALKTTVTKEYLQLANYYLRPRKVRTNSPSSQQLASLNLKEGSNKITFTFVTRVWGKQQVGARIYLWKWNTRIVISDVDGTITKSDVLGQVMPLVGKDWTQSGVARLFSSIKKNGYELMFLSARAISQAHLTRQFLESIKQDGEVLPDGPVVISPDGLFPSLYREVIRRAPHEFKIACLQDIKSLFPSESKPFYAGFGNRDTDELSYLKVGISKGKIFTINPKGEVVVNNRLDVKSYTSLHKLVHDMFPSMTVSQQEDYNEWNFWKLPLPDIEDELLVSSTSNSLGRKGVKSGKVS